MDSISEHNKLFSGPSWEMGKTYWHIQKADTEMQRRCYTEIEGKFGNTERIETEFGKEVGTDEIHWWIFKKEKDVGELLKRAERALDAAQKLKKDSLKLKNGYKPTNYLGLIDTLKEFTDNHKKEIHELYEYVRWLYNEDILAPSILFTYRVWGSTRLSDRFVEITADSIDEDSDKVQECTEFALGLRRRLDLILYKVSSEVEYDIFESDPEYYSSHTVKVPYADVYSKTSYKVLDELTSYFEFFRNSLRNILIDIRKYNAQNELLHSEAFWVKFIRKAMVGDRIEDQLWDFKESLDIWHTTDEKEYAKLCEKIAAFSNTTGGVLIVGITDKPPRKIIGIPDIENRVKKTVDIIKRYTSYDKDFIKFKQVLLKNKDAQDASCLVIAVAQTKKPVSVKDESNKFSYPVRSGTGLSRVDRRQIEESKRASKVIDNNFDFVVDLDRFLHA